MATFTASDRVERIGWDFDGVPHASGEGMVTGEHVKGVLPEPDEHKVEVFNAAALAIATTAIERQRRVLDAIDSAATSDEESDGVDDVYARQTILARAALIEIGMPKSVIEQLPPRYLAAFFDWMRDQLSGEDDAAS